jgi:site-specific recombinase XerD
VSGIDSKAVHSPCSRSKTCLHIDIANRRRNVFVLDFAYATRLRVSEPVGAGLDIGAAGRGDHWLSVIGRGRMAGKVAPPLRARTALDCYLVERKLPVTLTRWHPRTPLIGNLDQDRVADIIGVRLCEITRRFFANAAEVIEADNQVRAETLRRASPNWTRHTYAIRALARGAEAPTVRDNLRHASIATTSIYPHSDDVKRARQIREAFAN